MTKYSDGEKAAAAEREVAMRRSVYAIRIDSRKMTRAEADREIAIMQEIADDYRAREK